MACALGAAAATVGCSAPPEPAQTLLSALGLAARPLPIWLREGDDSRADALVERLRAADSHGLGPGRTWRAELEDALARARAAPDDADARQAADRELSAAFLRWLADLDRADPALVRVAHVAPGADRQRLDSADALRAAAEAPDIRAHLAGLEQRHPFYDALRTALAAAGDSDERRLLRLNLERARALPVNPGARHIVVDVARQRLWMFEGREAVDEMRVVVGEPSMATPIMSGVLDHVVTRPFWNVPDDLTRARIAPAVLQQGKGWLRARRMVPLAGWEPEAPVLDPAAVDWRAVAQGRSDVRVRQDPFAGNTMGNMKFMMPNPLGIYLHDTPSAQHFRRASRAFSAGCVRVEDWRRLAAWLFDGAVPQGDGTPEQRHLLAAPVPVHITYLTLFPEDGRMARGQDLYGLDRTALAALEDAPRMSSRRPAATTA